MDLEKELYLAAARAKKIPDSIQEKGSMAREMRHLLEDAIYKQVKLARNNLISMEDAIFRINNIWGDKDA